MTYRIECSSYVLSLGRLILLIIRASVIQSLKLVDRLAASAFGVRAPLAVNLDPPTGAGAGTDRDTTILRDAMLDWIGLCTKQAPSPTYPTVCLGSCTENLFKKGQVNFRSQHKSMPNPIKPVRCLSASRHYHCWRGSHLLLWLDGIDLCSSH